MYLMLVKKLSEGWYFHYSSIFNVNFEQTTDTEFVRFLLTLNCYHMYSYLLNVVSCMIISEVYSESRKT